MNKVPKIKSVILNLFLSMVFILCSSLSAQYNVTITDVNSSAITYYDYQTLGSAYLLESNHLNPNLLHAIFTVSYSPGPDFSGRNVKYFYSSNMGANWIYIGNVTQTRPSFPAIGLTNDGRAVVLVPSNDNGGSLRTMIYVDVYGGSGTWTVLDPGNNSAASPIYPVGVISFNEPSKIFWTANGFKNTGFSLIFPGSFTGYSHIDEPARPVMSAVGCSPNGKVGIAYITNVQSDVPIGSVKFIESSNNGISFSEPFIVWKADYRKDSLGALRGIDCSYNNETVNVVFEVCKRDPFGSFRPKEYSKIMFWAPNLNFSRPITLDSAAGLSGSNPTNDVMPSLCRPVIGNSYDQNFNSKIVAAYVKARQDTSLIGNNYFDVCFVLSTNNGLDWTEPYIMTNHNRPLYDYRYISISNRNQIIGSDLVYHLSAQADSIPGSSINGSPQSLAKLVYIRLQILNHMAGIVQSGTTISSEFNLKQNYPNPFNPVTQIEFSLPAESFISLKIYNSIGEFVATAAEGSFNAGNYKTGFNAANLASGVYFFILEYFLEKSQNSNFISKKMIFIK